MADSKGINTEKMQILCDEILEYADQANKILYDIEGIVDESSNYFKGDCFYPCKNKFEQIALSFPAVKGNIISYAEELDKLTRLYQDEKESINLTTIKDTNSAEVNFNEEV